MSMRSHHRQIYHGTRQYTNGINYTLRVLLDCSPERVSGSNTPSTVSHSHLPVTSLSKKNCWTRSPQAQEDKTLASVWWAVRWHKAMRKQDLSPQKVKSQYQRETEKMTESLQMGLEKSFGDLFVLAKVGERWRWKRETRQGRGYLCLSLFVWIIDS
jgi:hypothetical protein